MDKKRKKAYKKGLRAEWLAAFSLILKGYSLVERRYKTPVGEIDLILRKKELVLFVEVKARTSEEAALNSISRTAMRRISGAADWWISQQHDAANLNWRFDVIAVLPRRWPVHFKDVW